MHARIRATSTFLLLCCTLVAAPPARAGMFLRVESSVQGIIAGNATEQGHEDWIELQSFTHTIVVPTGTNGVPSGPPQTSPLFVTKMLDRATTGLFSATVDGDPLPMVMLDLTRVVGGGSLFTYYRIELEDAILVSMAQNGIDGPPPAENGSFTYSKITLRDYENGTVVSYLWNGGASSISEPLARGSILLPPTPNPTPGVTEFRFALPRASEATLALYDLRGRLVRELHRGWTPAEPTVSVWNGTDDAGVEVAQGVYLARLESPGLLATQRVVVVR